MKSTEPNTATKTAAERNRAFEREARAQGFQPLTAEALAALALGTADEAQDLLDVSAELRERSRRRRRRA